MPAGSRRPYRGRQIGSTLLPAHPRHWTCNRLVSYGPYGTIEFRAKERREKARLTGPSTAFEPNKHRGTLGSRWQPDPGWTDVWRDDGITSPPRHVPELPLFERSPKNSHRGLGPWNWCECHALSSLVPDFRFIRSLNLHAGAFLKSLVTFVRAGVGLSHVTIAHINWYYIIILYVSYFSQSFHEMLKFGFNDFSECLGQLDEPIWLDFWKFFTQ